MHKKFSGTLSTILLINNIVNIAASATMSAIVSSLSLNNNWEILYQTAIMTPIIVLIGWNYP
ncbi:CNNM domain-containing protein [Mesomycoplasma neurolyticum]|uniref:CNNM domain-containing protein n=1 Tax=Mesomycoplasma neurolyticum TaxID=2120 RepID=UPI0013EC1E42|nr:CNNM domain-containing protein [Mesomycoplasma neurolyticum]